MDRAGARTWILAGLMTFAFCAATVTRADADLWGHLRFGLDTIRLGHLTAIDPYSFTQDIPWVNHEWLSEVQIGAAWRIAGSAGVALLKGALLFGALLVLWPRISRLRIPVQVTVLVLLVVGTIHMWAFMRPQLWTLLCFTALCRSLTSSRRAVLALPALFVFWANCHGGSIVGLGVLGAWTGAAAVLGRPDKWRWLATWTLSAVATLINPYGWRLWAFMAQTVRLTRHIAEWEPLWTAPGLNWLPWIAAVACALWIVLSGRDDRRRWQCAAVLAPLAYGALRVQRLESLFVVAAIVLLAPWLPTRRSAPNRTTAAALWSARAFAVCAVAAAVAIEVSSLRCIRIMPDFAPDAAVMRALAAAPAGRLVTYFDWGEYAIWHVGPRIKVSIDGRRETVYSDARLVEADAVVRGSPDGLAALAAWKAEYVWLPATSRATRRWLETNGYRIDFDSPRSYLAVRADLGRLSTLAGSIGTEGCFPG